MDSKDITLEEKCENIMNEVVQYRKRYGKKCKEYEQKTSLVENKMLNLQLETISNHRFKSKNPITNIDEDNMMAELDDFAADIIQRNKRIEDLRTNIRNAQVAVQQLKADKLGRKLRQPKTIESMLDVAKNG